MERRKTAWSIDKSAGYLAPILLVATVVLVFADSLLFPFHAFDDVTFILRNPLITSDSPTPWIDRLLTPQIGYIVPITAAVERLLFVSGGGTPYAFHAASLALHTIVSLLIWRLVGTHTQSRTLPFTLALGFALHPIVVEPVCWATGLKDLLAATFSLLGCIFVQRDWQPNKASSQSGPPDKRSAWTSSICFILAALSKPTVALLPLAWLVYDILHRRPGSRWIAPAITSAIGLLLILMNKIMHETVINGPDGVSHRLTTPLTTLGHQIHHLIVPTSLHPIYLFDRLAGWHDWHTILGCAVFCAVALWAWTSRSRKETLYWLSSALVCYLPVSGIIPFPRQIGDSYMYLPLALIAIAASGSIILILERLLRRSLPIVLLVVIAMSIPLTTRQIHRWKSSKTLWGPLARDYPHRPEAWILLAQGWHFEQHYNWASRAFEQAIARDQTRKYHRSFARTLVLAGELSKAECVLNTLIRDENGFNETALIDLALLLISYPSYRPNYPRVARQALLSVNRRLTDKKLTLPQAKRQLISQRIKRLRNRSLSARSAGDTTPLHCESLQRSPVSVDSLFGILTGPKTAGHDNGF